MVEREDVQERQRPQWVKIRNALRRGDQRSAHRMALRWVRLHPRDPVARELGARVLMMESDFQGAEKILRGGVRWTRSPSVRFWLADVLVRQGNFVAAEDVIRDLARNDPEGFMTKLALLSLALAQEDMQSAARYGQEAFSLSQRAGPMVLFELAVRLMKVPDHLDDVVQLLRRCLKARPNEVLPMLYLSVLLESTDPTESERLRETVVASWDGGRDEVTSTVEGIKGEYGLP
jgi:hypothetical protein